MSLKFSQAGPKFPSNLVDSLLAGEVVFLCGAGISAPQLPDFASLVELCFSKLKMQKSPSEQQSINDGRFEEALGSLSRRLVDPEELTQVVKRELRTSPDDDLSHHHTLIRLSRNLDNHPSIITTNFDTMLEHALLESEGTTMVRAHSFAGQDLPKPSTSNFSGVIHLHGRIDDEHIGLEETPLIITSSDYGDAYMRSGWASRFLFDLCRCKTIVLIGYSAGDAPVRYFLNVIETDRERFSDLKHVYALTSVTDHGEPDSRWEALAVTPITYEIAKEGHEPLWRDLSALAEVVERPRITRQSWARKILSRHFSDTTELERDRIVWLFRDKSDLWSIASNTVDDIAWLEFFDEKSLWNKSVAASVMAAWFTRDLSSPKRFRQAIEWRKKLDNQFAIEIVRRIRRDNSISEFWLRAWHLLCISEPKRRLCWEDSSFAIRQLLSTSVVLHAFIEKAVNAITPVLEFSPRFTLDSSEPVDEFPKKIGQLAWSRFHVPDRVGARELITALVELPNALEVLTIATNKLQTIIGLSIDCDSIIEDYDSNSAALPSVEPHPQNEYCDGAVFLIELIAQLLPLAIEQNRDTARALTDVWRSLPGKLGLRLWLHALTHSKLFDSDEILRGLTSLSTSDFWSMHPELPLVLRELSANADSSSLTQLEERILSESTEYYSRFAIEEEQVDWRTHARDKAVWLRLKMLEHANALSTIGSQELQLIQDRNQYLNREVEEQDFFGTYSTGVRTVVGDAEPILNASDTDRLDIARSSIESSNLESQLGWSAYCRTDPQGAFDSLKSANLDDRNAPLWAKYLESLAFSDSVANQTSKELILEIFDWLASSSNSFLDQIIDPLVILYSQISWRNEPSIIPWRPRLFSAVFNSSVQEPLKVTGELLETAINSSGGRLTQATLVDIEEQRNSNKLITSALMEAIILASSTEGLHSTYAQAVLIKNAGFVFSILGFQPVHEALRGALSGEQPESRALREVLVNYGNLSIKATHYLSAQLLDGLIEFDGDEYKARVAAAKLIRPALSIIAKDNNSSTWGLVLEDVSRVIQTAKPALRVGIGNILQQWISEFDDAATAWRDSIQPLLDQTWPRDRTLRDRRLSHHFAGLIIGAGDAFPEALDWAIPYLDKIDEDGSTFAIVESQAPEQFPNETLILLWKLFGISSPADRHGIAEILDRLVAAAPSLETDRRFQWLYQHASRYD